MKDKEIEYLAIFAGAFMFFFFMWNMTPRIGYGIVYAISQVKETFKTETAIDRHYDYTDLIFVGNFTLGAPIQRVTIERDFWDNCTFIEELDVYIIDCDKV